MSRPSLKLGTHSTIRFSIGNEVRFILSKIKKIREKYEKIVTKKATPDSETAFPGFSAGEAGTEPEIPAGRKSERRVTRCRKTGGGTKGGKDFGKNRETGKIGKIGRYGKPPPRRWCAILPPFPRLSTLQGEEKAPKKRCARLAAGASKKSRPRKRQRDKATDNCLSLGASGSPAAEKPIATGSKPEDPPETAARPREARRNAAHGWRPTGKKKPAARGDGPECSRKGAYQRPMVSATPAVTHAPGSGMPPRSQ